MVFQQQQTMTTAAEFPASNGTSTSDRPKNGLHPDPLANFLVEPARKEHLAEINEFLFTDFLTTEPLNASVGLTREESADFFNYLVESSFHDGISYLVRDPAAKSRLVAVRLAFISRRNGHQHNGNGQEATAVVDPFAKGYPEGGNVAKICAILHAVESKIWQLVPAEIDTLASWLILSVHSDYKRRGIAGALLEHRLDKFRALGCQGIVTEASARNSQNLFKKLGYQRIFELLHADWIGANGKPVFKCLDGTDRVTLEFKPFPTAKST